MERLFGMETEYALTALGRDGNAAERSEALNRLLGLARRKLVHLPGADCHGIFLANGGRLYIDSGLHPEFCTPESANPWDVVRYVEAGQRIVQNLASDLAREPEYSEILLLKCNVDYGGARTSWGAHESYMHKANPRLLSEEVIPHLVSRLIYTGAGGFNSLSCGVEFTLSPRVPHLEAEVSDSSTYNRGIFHTKDEPLTKPGYHRFHALCGESLCSQTAAWLKVACTAMVVAMTEGGLRPGKAVRLRNSLGAMRTFAGDPECKATVELVDGRRLTAETIQRQYLELAEQHLRDDFMPPWAPEACEQWRAMLDRLRDAPASVETALDWAIKYALFRNRVARSARVTWESLPHWTYLLGEMLKALQETPYRDKTVTVEFVLSPQSPVKEAVDRLGPYLREHGLAWDALRPFLQLRCELFEIDARFGQLGQNGIFEAMDGAGVLSHRLAGVDNIEHAMEHPPAVGRASVRGQCIRRLAGSNGRYVCDWQMVLDNHENRVCDLADPFATEEKWREQARHREDHLDGRALRDLDIRQLFEAHRARLAARRAAMSPEYRIGSRVVIAPSYQADAEPYAGRAAVVTSVGRDEGGPYYRLDVDGGRMAWRAQHLRPEVPAPVPPTPPERR